MSKGKYYAVAVGRDGPQIYEDWPATERAVKGYSGGTHKKFGSRLEAEDWLRSKISRVGVSTQPGSRIGQSGSLSHSTQRQSTAARNSMPRELTGKADFTPRLTTRYEPYPNSVARQGNTGQSTSKILTYGVPPRNPPQTSSQPTSSQSNPIPISSDVEEDDLVFTHSIAPPSAPETRSTAIPTANNNMSTSRVRRQLDKVSNLGALMDTPEATHQQSPASEMAVVEESVTSADTTLLEHGEPILSDQQQQVLKRVLKGESIFFTGSAGVGKSVLTRAIIRALERKYPSPNQVAVTATTGIAATNVGGGTLHSWAGLGLAKMSVDRLFGAMIKGQGRPDVLSRWRECKVLVIDEVSMLDGRYFDKLEQIGRLVRRNTQPFGGIQLVVTGDFFQLPPVPDWAAPGEKRQDSQFVFESQGWKQAVPEMVILTQVFRQRDDTFIRLLNEARLGVVSSEAAKSFNGLSRKVHYEDGVEPTCLYARRSQVLAENNRRLRQLPGDIVTYTAADTSGKSAVAPYNDLYPQEKELRACLDKNTLVEYSQDLKVGAQVMLVKNLRLGGLVNGSMGRVIGFATVAEVNEANYPGFNAPAPAFPSLDAALQDGGNDGGKQPVNDGWPHVSKPALSTDMLETSNLKDETMNPPLLSTAAAALKASTTNDGAPEALSLVGVRIATAALSEREIRRLGYGPGDKVDEEPALLDLNPRTAWPIVEFIKGKQRFLLPPMDFSVENANGKVEASRSQIPLILAWALSIHKSQGQTLERVKIDIGDIFECGQAYVALSRATQMETLQVMRFNPNKVKAHPKVKKWYESID